MTGLSGGVCPASLLGTPDPLHLCSLLRALGTRGPLPLWYYTGIYGSDAGEVLKFGQIKVQLWSKRGTALPWPRTPPHSRRAARAAPPSFHRESVLCAVYTQGEGKSYASLQGGLKGLVSQEVVERKGLSTALRPLRQKMTGDLSPRWAGSCKAGSQATATPGIGATNVAPSQTQCVGRAGSWPALPTHRVMPFSRAIPGRVSDKSVRA